jgi:hypothetical protein
MNNADCHDWKIVQRHISCGADNTPNLKYRVIPPRIQNLQRRRKRDLSRQFRGKITRRWRTGPTVKIYLHASFFARIRRRRRGQRGSQINYEWGPRHKLQDFFFNANYSFLCVSHLFSCHVTVQAFAPPHSRIFFLRSRYAARASRHDFDPLFHIVFIYGHGSVEWMGTFLPQ